MAVCFSEAFFFARTAWQLNGDVHVFLWRSLQAEKDEDSALIGAQFYQALLLYGCLTGGGLGFSVRIRINVRFGFEKD